MTIGEHSVIVTGSENFVDRMLDWWLERVDDFELRKVGGEKDGHQETPA